MSDSLDSIFGALSDPTRRAILVRLAEGEASVAELAQPFDLSPRAIAKHVTVLESAGLVSRRREAQRNMARLNDEAIAEAERWIHTHRQSWMQRFERLSLHLAKDTDDQRG